MICRICGALVAGAHLGIYQVQQLLGKGRSGDAYLAAHLRSKQLAVLKLFPPDPACKNLWEAVRHEVRIITTLRHSSILPVFSSSTWSPDARSSSSQSLPDLLAAPGRAEYLLTLSQYAPATLIGKVRYTTTTSETTRGLNPISLRNPAAFVSREVALG